MLRPRDLRLLAPLLAVPALAFALLWLSGSVLFWGDLTYLHHPWRALAAQMIQAGRLPLWNPYAYLGMPLAAELQCAAWYPGTLPFNLFPFAPATLLFLAVHSVLIAFFGFLWLRREGFGRAASWGGAAALSGSGILAGHLSFLNQISSLAYLPAFLLFRGSPWLLGTALALCFLSGYPTMAAGGALAAWAVSWAAGSRPSLKSWALAGAFAAGAGACLLLPGLELALGSQRGAGLPLEETLNFGFEPGDLLQWIGPLAVPREEFSPALFWWKTCYAGLAAAAAALAGLARLRRGPRLRFAAYLLLGVLLLLGGGNRASAWVWVHVPVLHYVRYPGNLAYLAWPALAFLCAAGLRRGRRAGAWALLVAVELAAYVSQPVVPASYFADAGLLIRELQRRLGERRYALSPRALHWHRGFGESPVSAALDLKHRLYGVTGMPYRLAAVANFGEPMVPLSSYRFMDFLFRRPGLDAAGALLPWAGTAVLLTRERLPSRTLRYEGERLWHWYRVPGPPSRAFWLDEASGAAVPGGLSEGAPLPDLRDAVPVELHRGREDRFRVSGLTSAGWVYVAEPRVRGWTARLDGRSVRAEAALEAFQKLRVPGGDWELRFRYDPGSWRWGLVLSLLSLSASGAYWYNRARKMTVQVPL